MKEKLLKYKQRQIKYIEDGFNQIYERLKSKETSLSEEFTVRYEEKIESVKSLLENVNKFQQNCSDINVKNLQYKDILESFKESANQPKGKIRDIQEHIKSSMISLDNSISEVDISNLESCIKSEAKPLIINVDRALKVIGNFKVEHSNQLTDKQNNVRTSVNNSSQKIELQPIEPDAHQPPIIAKKLENLEKSR